MVCDAMREDESVKTIEGKFGIKATVLASSVHMYAQDIRLTTFEIEYPRIILAEENTHRALSKNSHSSRAIPFTKMVGQLTGRPVRFGAANPGMQDTGKDHTNPIERAGNNGVYPLTPEQAWNHARESAIFWSRGFFEAGYHKQVYNRLTEPFQMMRTIVSGTELANFFWLRKHGAADPTLEELATVMHTAYHESKPEYLKPGEWHVPYVNTHHEAGYRQYYIWEGVDDDNHYVALSPEQAVKVSAARCAAVSFRNLDYGLEKSLQVYDRLVGDDRKHASAFEHQATPMRVAQDLDDTGWEEGVSHCDRDDYLWSGNFKGFIQNRKLIPGENYTGPF